MDPTNELTVTQTNKKKQMVIKQIKVLYWYEWK